MRAGPLSNDKVIDTLNRYFAPVFVSNEDYQEKTGVASPQEKKEYRRLFDEFLDKKLPCGTVHVYLIGTDGHPIESMHVANASRTEKLMGMLRRCIDRLGVQPGEPLVKPADTSVAPPAPAGALVLHLVSRGENTGPQGGSWREFPAENWIVLSANQAEGLLPRAEPAAGATYNVNSATATKIFQYFYPQSEDPTDSPWTKMDVESLKATVLSVNHGAAIARLEGRVQLHRDFYPGKYSPERMTATLLGFMQWEPETRRITSFKLVTDEAKKDDGHYAVAVRMER